MTHPFVSATVCKYFLEENLKNKRVECSAHYCDLYPFSLHFLCGLCGDATLLVYYILLVPQHKVIKDKHCFLSTKKTIKSGVPEAQRFETHVIQP